MSHEQDAILVRQCLEGDQKAFETLIDRYQRPIFNLALRFAASREDAEDIVQTVFVKVYEKLNTYDPKHKFFSWLYKIAVNESINHLNRRKNLEPFQEDLHSGHQTQDEPQQDHELTKKIDSALLELKPDYRIVVVLNHFQDLTYREIGQILDIHENKVKSRLFSARRKLRSILMKKGISHA
jgi:RNA polymerase sigma-70 factor (ECF subfamily)